MAHFRYELTHETPWKYQLTGQYMTQLPEFDWGVKGGILTIDFIELDLFNGVLSIRNTYAWDGSSGPAIDTANSMRGSCVHDALYALLRAKRLLPRGRCRKAADRAYRRILVEDEMGEWRARRQYWGVRIGGVFAMKVRRRNH